MTKRKLRVSKVEDIKGAYGGHPAPQEKTEEAKVVPEATAIDNPKDIVAEPVAPAPEAPAAEPVAPAAEPVAPAPEPEAPVAAPQKKLGWMEWLLNAISR